MTVPYYEIRKEKSIERIIPVALFRRLVKDANERDILGSVIYYDMLKMMPYLEEGVFSIRDFAERYPRQMTKLVAQYKINDYSVTHHFTNVLTEAGVRNVCQVFGLDEKTLKKHSDIHLKQNGLFHMMDEKPDVNSKAVEDFAIEQTLSQLFQNGDGLVEVGEDSGDYESGRNWRVYVRNYNDRKENVIIGINYGICKYMSKKFASVKKMLTGELDTLKALFYVDGNKVTIRFIEHDDPHALTIRRSLKQEDDGLSFFVNNASVRKSDKTAGLIRALKQSNLVSVDTRDIEISDSMQTIVARFDVEQ